MVMTVTAAEFGFSCSRGTIQSGWFSNICVFIMFNGSAGLGQG